MPNVTITINESTCDCCGQVTPYRFPVINAEGDTLSYCDECVRNTNECDRCGDSHVDDLITVIDSDGYERGWCEHCADSYAANICEHCGERCESTTPVVVGYDYYDRRQWEDWCESCRQSDATYCEHCEEYHEDSLIDSYHLYDNTWITLCDHCCENEYTECEDCRELVPRDDAEWINGDPYCPYCADDHCESEGSNVVGYHHTSGMTFWFDDGSSKEKYELNDDEKHLLYLGIELECDGNDSRADLADDIIDEFGYGRVECKKDGSLGYEGLEIVGQPMTPSCCLTSGMWERIAGLVRMHGGVSYDSGNCGLHIHGSRNFFKNHDAVYRLDRIFHRFERQLVKFARRRDSQMHWCRINDDSELLEIKDIEERKEAWRKKKNYGYESRYQAVNDKNENTVEIRLWRGSLNVETIRATIEMTAGLFIVANAMSDELADTLNWSMLKLLVRYALESNGLPHDDLDSYLVRRGL